MAMGELIGYSLGSLGLIVLVLWLWFFMGSRTEVRGRRIEVFCAGCVLVFIGVVFVAAERESYIDTRPVDTESQTQTFGG